MTRALRELGEDQLLAQVFPRLNRNSRVVIGAGDDCAVVKYAAPFSLGRFFRALGETNQSKLQIELPKQFLPQLESGRAYFLPSYYAP
jgi:hypothetical protein